MINLALRLFMGIGLSASAGFKVFVPLFVISLAAKTGHLEIANQFRWLGTNIALVTFAIATILEIGAYFIPWIDNMLNLVAIPVAVVAGIIITASFITDMSPFLQWGLALISGSGVAGTIQGTTTGARGVSTATTGGVANPVVTLVETFVSIMISVLSILVPLLTVVFVLGLIFFILRRMLPKLIQSGSD